MVAPRADGDASATTTDIRRLIFWSHYASPTKHHIGGILAQGQGWKPLLDEVWQNENWKPDYCLLSEGCDSKLLTHMANNGFWDHEWVRRRPLPNNVSLESLEMALARHIPRWTAGKIETILIMMTNRDRKYIDSFDDVTALLTGSKRFYGRSSRLPFVAMLESPGSWNQDTSLDPEPTEEGTRYWTLKNRKMVDGYNWHRSSRTSNSFCRIM